MECDRRSAALQLATMCSSVCHGQGPALVMLKQLEYMPWAGATCQHMSMGSRLCVSLQPAVRVAGQGTDFQPCCCCCCCCWCYAWQVPAGCQL
jgi:hypothetical protein